MAATRLKLTNAVLDQISFSQVPIGIKAGVLITTPNIGKLAPDGTMRPPTDYIIRDTEDKGFGIRVSPNCISFFVQRKMGGSASVKRTIGTWRKEFRTVAEARLKAAKWLGFMRDGQDPLLLVEENLKRLKEANEKKRRTFGKVFQDYIDTREKKVAKKTLSDWKQVQKGMLETKLWKTPFNEIEPEIIQESLAYWFEKNPEYEKRHSAKRNVPEYLHDAATGHKYYRVCCAAYNFEALEMGIHDKKASPFARYRKNNPLPKVKRRTTILPTSETAAKAWLKRLCELRDAPAFRDAVVADYLLCVLLWGGRKTETQLLQWDDIDFKKKTITFRAENTKNKEEHVFPLTPFAESILVERKKKNQAPRKMPRGVGHQIVEQPTEEIWVFPSNVPGKHIVDIRRVLNMCKESSDLHIGAHDLRRTFATKLAIEFDGVVDMVKVAMNHSNARHDVTMEYIQEKVDLLRPKYEAHEHKVRQLAGLAPEINVEAVDIKALLSDPAFRKIIAAEVFKL